MGCVIFLLIAGFLYMAGDQVSSWLWPTLAPAVGYWILLGSFTLVSALLWTPSRFLAQSVVMAAITTMLVILRVLAQGFLGMFRLMYSSGRAAFARFWGDVQ